MREQKQKITASDLMLAMLWHLVKDEKNHQIYLSNIEIVDLIGQTVKKNKNYRKIFTTLGIFFNLDNYPIDSRSLGQILANFSLIALIPKQIPEDLLSGRRFYTLNGENYLENAKKYFRDLGQDDIFEQFLEDLKNKFDNAKCKR